MICLYFSKACDMCHREITCEDGDQGQQKSCKLTEGPVKGDMAADIAERGGTYLKARFL